MADYNSSLPVRTETDGDIVAKIGDGATPSQYLGVDAAGKITVKLNDGAGTAITSQVNGAQQALDVGVNVAGVQIDPRDIRALTSADVVTADQGAPNTAANGWPVKPTDGTNSQAFTAAGEALVKVNELLPEDHDYGAVGANTLRTAAQIGNATGAADFDYGAVGAQTLRTAAEIGNATGAADFNNGATGAQTLRTAANLAVAGANVSVLNPVPVFVTSAGPSGTHVNDYKDATAIAGAASDNHDYTVTALKTLTLNSVLASASGKAKMEIQIETAVASGVFLTKFVQFNSTADTNMEVVLTDSISVAAGVRVRVIMTNLDKAAQDLYSTICGTEN